MTSPHIERLQDLLLKSAAHIDKHGHHQFDMWEGKACCIMGAPRMVGKEVSYSHILRDVLAFLGYDEPWNDKPGRTKEEVVTALESCYEEMTPETLRAVYGPKWSAILDFIVDVDNWTEADYDEIVEQTEGLSYPPNHGVENRQYLNALVGFLATVMTSGKANNSVPFKQHFDTHYEKEWKDNA